MAMIGLQVNLMGEDLLSYLDCVVLEKDHVMTLVDSRMRCTHTCMVIIDSVDTKIMPIFKIQSKV
jgi:hypothetical protein